MLEPDEILTGVAFPVPATSVGTAFAEVTVRHWGDPTLVVALAAVTIDDGRCAGVELGLGGVAPISLRVSVGAGAVLVGQEPGDAVLDAAAEAASAGLEPPADVHGSGAYRRRLARHLARQVLGQAFAHTLQEVRA